MNTFYKTIQDLRDISSLESEFNSENYLDILHKLTVNNTFKDFLFSIKKDESVLCHITSQSYLHQNGFDKLVLSTNYDLDWRLRLHIWWSNLNDFNGFDYDIHNHSWDFSSVILEGVLINEVFQLEENGKVGKDFFHHVYSIDDESSQANLKLVGKKKLYLKSSTTYKKGEVYAQKKEKLHRAFPKEGIKTVTMIVQEKPRQDFSDVFKPIEMNYSKSIGLTGNLITKQYLLDTIDLLLK